MPSLWLLLACAPAPCQDGYGRDAAGHCVPLATAGADDTATPDEGVDTSADDTATPDSAADTAPDDTAPPQETADTGCDPSPDVWNRRDDDCDGVVDLALVDDVAAAMTASETGYDRICAVDNLISGGDLDGDGAVDLAAGAIMAADGAGRVYALPTTGWSGDVADDAIWILEAEGATDALGTVGQHLGDADGDGLADLLVGAPGAADGGRAYLLRGGARGGSIAAENADGIVYGGDGGAAGTAVSLAADLDGDGRADLAVGDPTGGRVGIFSTPPSGAVALDDAAALLTDAETTRAGESLAAGDLDGDGYGELLIGAPRDDNAHAHVYVVPGGAALPTGDLDAAAAWRVQDMGAGMIGATNRGLEPPADVDGSGAADLIVADTDGAREVYVFLDPPTGALSVPDAATILSPGEPSIGSATQTADIDGDGIPDLIAGAYYDDTWGNLGGAVYLMWGGALPAGYVMDRDAMHGLLDAGGPERYLGTGLAGPGDLDGDGADELLICASRDSTRAALGGAIFLLAGEPGY